MRAVKLKYRHWRVLVIGAATVAASLAIIALSGVTSPGSNVASVRLALQTAEATWAARPVRHYRLVVEQEPLLRCTYTIEVQDERMISEDTNCPRAIASKTVTALFAAIRDEIADWQEIPVRCFRDEGEYFWVMDAAFDPRYGFPQHAQARLVDGCAWRHAGLGGPDLARLPITFIVRSFTPLASAGGVVQPTAF